MKSLLILLFFFSAYSFSIELKEKVLICIDEQKYINKEISKSDYIFGYIFNNETANYYYNTVTENGMYDIGNILNIKYNVNDDFIIIELEYGNLFINRNTLEHSFNNDITARCELAESENFFFNLLKERKKKLNDEIEKN